MLGGVKFCGGCNPRFDRGKVYETVKKHFTDKVNFVIAQEDETYDFVLVIGGCTNCCASYHQLKTKSEYILIWDESHVDKAINKIKELGGMNFGLEGNL